ncbi:MAG: type IV-A pilus assembly ATPase PilB [Candidatus Stahlbacteria bacterium]|nr:type IV-A pilus assembly ATPase PilB [Candidatus Stahlbacteria bacterium]
MRGVRPEKLIDALLSASLISKESVEKINRYIRLNKGDIEDAIITQNILSEIEYMQFLSEYLGIPAIDMSELQVPDAILQLVPQEFAEKTLCVPIKKKGKFLQIAMADPTDIALIDDMKFVSGYEIEPYIASKKQIDHFINRHYKKEAMHEIMKDVILEDVEVVKEQDVKIDLKELAAAIEDTPIVRYVDSLITSSIRKGASDIHIEPYEKLLRVRTRIDSILFEEQSPPFKLRNAIVSRVKVMSNMDLAEHRVPQDGRIKMRLKDKDVDLRVSTLPTLYGEKVVMRILDKSALCVDLEKLGIEKEPLDHLSRAIQSSYGFILVTGPTGSGKTTTLYSALSRINTPDVNIMTAEDPIEYNFVGINQVQTREKVGLTFANALKSFLRQDPDIIMVGEIRDHETASIAIHAALTGHLVLSTLHTNDAPSSISRLMDMGIEPFLISSSLTLIVAQRLIRRICPRCKEPTTVAPEAIERAGLNPEEIADITPYHGRGCDDCQGGYRGREGVYEIMVVTQKIRDLTVERRPATEIMKAAISEGMMTLKQSALLKFKKGITTLEEVLRVTATI